VRQIEVLMSLAGQLFAGLAGAIHVLIFVMESVLFSRPQIYGRFLIASADEARAVRPFAFNQGFYNLFLAIGVAIGLSWQGTIGTTLVAFCTASMLAAALVLIGTNRRMLRPALLQGLLPLLALLTLWL
jgi:putative membrane protein